MLNDLRYAFRTLRRSPGFAASAILALALGIGANTAVFSVVYAVLLKPLPYPQPDRLVRLSERNPSRGLDDGSVSAGTFLDWRSRSRTLESVALYRTGGEALWDFGDRSQVVRTSAVSPALFEMLRVRSILGRAFRPEQEEDRPAGDTGRIVLSYDLWQRTFGGAPDIVGRTVRLEGRLQREIIGVLPRGFAFPEGTEAWTNLAFAGPAPEVRGNRWYEAIGRLAPGATIESARSELDGIAAQLASEHPASNGGWTTRIEPLAGSDSAGARPALMALLGAVAGVLLIACASVANLLLARATARRREIAVRLALGAGTSRLVRQCFTEALLIAVFGTGAGIVLGYWLSGLLVRLAPPDIPRLQGVGMSGPLLLFVATAGLISAGLIGLAPAAQAARAERRGELRADNRGASGRGGRARGLLIAGQVAVVVLLLTGALLLLRTFVKLRGVDLGFAPQHVFGLEARWPTGRFVHQPQPGSVRPWPRVQRALDELVAAVRSVPGVEAAGLTSHLPLGIGDLFSTSVWRADAAGASGLEPPTSDRDLWNTDLTVVTGGYFSAMRIPFVRGRSFVDTDRLTDEQLKDPAVPRSGVAVINEAFALRYFLNTDPIGQTLVIAEDSEFGASRTIVGIVGDVRGRAVAEIPVPAVFVPQAQHPDLIRPIIVLRSAVPPAAIFGAIRHRIAAFDPQLLVLRMWPMDDVVSGALSRPRFNLVLVGSFALVALVLSAIGIYGVVAFLVTERTREIGIRMALGARAGDVVRLVLREGLSPVLFGGGAGILGSLVATQAIRSMLFGVTRLDAVSFAAAPALLAAVALLACYVPARRATRVDPLVALREE